MSEVKEPKTVPRLSTVLKKLTVESRLKSCVIRVDNADDAKNILKLYNIGNRPITKSQWKLYANELLRGKWELNGEPFIFGIDDSTDVESAISLQHRLLGLIEAFRMYELSPDSYPEARLFIETVAVYNVPIQVADTNDQGMTRKHGHVLYRDEWVAKVIPPEWSNNNSRKAKWCNALAVAARLVWLRSGGATVSSAPKFIVSEMLEFIKENHPKLPEFVSSVMSSAEEEGAGLKISIPYIAALCYIASLDEDGKVHKATKDIVLDAMLSIAQNTVTPGTAQHALVAYWNKLFASPGGKDRDLDIVGPFVKALSAIINEEKITASKLALTAKEKESYATHPPLLAGYDEACFIYAQECKAEAIENATKAKEQALADRESAKAEKQAEKERVAAEKAEAKAAKDAEKAAAKEEADTEKSAVPVKTGVMSALNKAVKAKPTAANAEVQAKPMIKRKPVPSSK